MRASPVVVLVTTSSVIAEVYSRYFEQAQWECVVTTNLGDAERKSVRLRPAVLLIDTHAVEDIVQELKRLRRLPTLMKTRRVVIAKHATHAVVHDVLAADAEMILTPHMSPRAVVDRLTEPSSK